MENIMNNEIMDQVVENTVAEVNTPGISKVDFGKGLATGVIGTALAYGAVKIGTQVFKKLKAKKEEKAKATEASTPNVEVDGKKVEGVEIVK